MRRKPLRHPTIDYGAGSWFFVTTCASSRGDVFGCVRDDEVVLNRRGRVVAAHLAAIEGHFVNVTIDDHIVMPDHVHAVVGLDAELETRLGTVVGSFKSGVSRELGGRVWQRGYYDHRIRDESDLDNCRAYIRGNPFRWRRKRGPDPGEASLAPTDPGTEALPPL